MRSVRGPRRSNCLFWAFVVWRRKRWRGCLWMRRSTHSPLKMHFGWESEHGLKWSYEPISPVSNVVALCHGLRFRGRVTEHKNPP